MSLDTRASPGPRATALLSAKEVSLLTHEALGPMLVRGLFTRGFLLLLLPHASCFCFLLGHMEGNESCPIHQLESAPSCTHFYLCEQRDPRQLTGDTPASASHKQGFHVGSTSLPLISLDSASPLTTLCALNLELIITLTCLSSGASLYQVRHHVPISMTPGRTRTSICSALV